MMLVMICFSGLVLVLRELLPFGGYEIPSESFMLLIVFDTIRANVGRTGDLRFMHVQYPDGKKADDEAERTNGKGGGALSGYYADRPNVPSAGLRGYV